VGQGAHVGGVGLGGDQLAQFRTAGYSYSMFLMKCGNSLLV
jgi:hypothetical protein